MRTIASFLLVAALLFAAGCECRLCAQAAAGQTAPAPQGQAPASPEPQVAPITRAICVLHPTQGSNVHGTVTFTAVDGAVLVVADIQGLTPGRHGFHVHEFGDCSAPDASSAGSHWNPGGCPHAGPEAASRHAGDLGNIEADAAGNAHIEWRDPVLALTGPTSIIGRSVIVHANPDDLATQPTGNAGPRVACGVIGIARAP